MNLLKSWLGKVGSPPGPERPIDVSSKKKTILRKRIIACLDVRTDDHGDLVVTKGDQVIHLENRRPPHCVVYVKLMMRLHYLHHLFSLYSTMFGNL